MQRCFVADCRHAHTHVTAGHRCGRCGGYGHGQRECGSARETRELRERYGTDTLPLPERCPVPTCAYRHIHTEQGHYCRSCKTFGCTVPTCRTRSGVSIQCPVCRVVNPAVDITAVVYTGSDCTVCMDTQPCVVFPTCRHACVCPTCAVRL